MLKKTLTSLYRSYNEGSRSTGCATVYTTLAQFLSCKKLIFNYFLLTHVFLVTQYKDYSMYLSYCNFYWNTLIRNFDCLHMMSGMCLSSIYFINLNIEHDSPAKRGKLCPVFEMSLYLSVGLCAYI